MVVVVLHVILALSLSFSMWFMICYEKTMKQRNDLLDFYVFKDPTMSYVELKRLQSAYNAVSFNKHLSTLLFFRDPRKLYDPVLFGEE